MFRLQQWNLLRCRTVASEQPSEGILDGVDVQFVEATACKGHRIDRSNLRWMPFNDHVGRHIPGNPGQASDEAACADGREVMDPSTTADARPIVNGDVSGQHDLVGNDRIVVQVAVVRDVGSDHEQVPVTDPRHPATASGAAMNGHMLPDLVVVPDFAGRLLTCVLAILRVDADHGVRIEAISPPDDGVLLDRDMVHQLRPITDLYTWTNHAPWPDRRTLGDGGGWIDDGSGMNRHGVVQLILTGFLF